MQSSNTINKFPLFLAVGLLLSAGSTNPINRRLLVGGAVSAALGALLVHQTDKALPQNETYTALVDGITIPLPENTKGVAVGASNAKYAQFPQSPQPRIHAVALNTDSDKVTGVSVHNWSATAHTDPAHYVTSKSTDEADINFLKSLAQGPTVRPDKFCKFTRPVGWKNILKDAFGNSPTVNPITKTECSTSEGTYRVELQDNGSKIHVRLGPSNLMRFWTWARIKLAQKPAA